jgi:hypothetical protein
MYQKIIFLLVFSLFLLSAGRQTYSQNDLDTLWSKRISIVENAIFSPDDSKILVSCTEKFVELEGTTGDVLSEVAPFGGIHGLSENRQFAVTLHPPIRIIDANDYSEIKVLSDKINIDGNYKIYYFSFTNDFKTFAFMLERLPQSYNSGTIIIMNSETFEYYLPFEPGDYEHYNLAIISPDGRFLLTLHGDFNLPSNQNDNQTKVRLWSLETKQMIDELIVTNGFQSIFMEWSPNSRYISIYDGLNISIYNTDIMMFIDTVKASGGATPIAMQFNNNSEYLYFLNNDILICRYVLSNKEIDKTYIYPRYYEFMHFSGNEEYFIAGDRNELQLFNSNIFSSVEENAASISISPNPTKGIFKLILPFSCKIMNIDLYNAKGELITKLFHDHAIEGQILTFDISTQPTGAYLIQICGDYRTESCKIIKE